MSRTCGSTGASWAPCGCNAVPIAGARPVWVGLGQSVLLLTWHVSGWHEQEVYGRFVLAQMLPHGQQM